jgi:hypothetical protein
MSSGKSGRTLKALDFDGLIGKIDQQREGGDAPSVGGVHLMGLPRLRQAKDDKRNNPRVLFSCQKQAKV